MTLHTSRLPIPTIPVYPTSRHGLRKLNKIYNIVLTRLIVSNVPLSHFFFFFLLFRDGYALHHGAGALRLRADQHAAGVQGAAAAAATEGRRQRRQLPEAIDNQNGRYGE